MANFAIIENGIVENIISADTLETAQEITGKVCVEYAEDSDNRAHIGLSYSDGIFEQLETFPID
jgi:hypothetical protein